MRQTSMGRISEEVVSLYSFVLHIAKRYYKHSDDCQDLASETILKMLEAEEHFDTSRNLKPWACAVMHNTFVTQYKRRSLIEYVASDKFDVAYDEGVYHTIKSYLDQMSKSNINIRCLMFFVNGYAYSEIAKKFQIPIGTVKSRINTGRKLLRQKLHL